MQNFCFIFSASTWTTHQINHQDLTSLALNLGFVSFSAKHAVLLLKITWKSFQWIFRIVFSPIIHFNINVSFSHG